MIVMLKVVCKFIVCVSQSSLEVQRKFLYLHDFGFFMKIRSDTSDILVFAISWSFTFSQPYLTTPTLFAVSSL